MAPINERSIDQAIIVFETIFKLSFCQKKIIGNKRRTETKGIKFGFPSINFPVDSPVTVET